jgi:hypothetical protein
MKPLVMDSTLDILVIITLKILAGVLLILGSDLEAWITLSKDINMVH